MKSKKKNQIRVSARYILYRVRSELRVETSRNYLSYIWWLLEPILTIAVFYIVFGMLFDQGGEDFVSFLLLGVTAWFWFAHTVMQSTESIRSEMSLMQQVYVPKYVFPIAAVGFGLFKHLFVIAVLMGLLFAIERPSDTWLFFFLVFLVQFVLILAISTTVAAIVPFIPDLTLVIPPLMRLGMFVSGVFYSQAMIPQEYVAIFRYNPMAGLIMEYRKVVLYSQLPDFTYLAGVFFLSISILAGSLFLLNRWDRIYPRLTS